MITLKSIQIKDFLSHEDTEIDFGVPSKVLLDGQSGGGKSSILDAILFALYGESRCDARSLIRKGQTSAKISLCLFAEVAEDNNRKTSVLGAIADIDKRSLVRVTRAITAGGKHTLSIETSNPDCLDGSGDFQWVPVPQVTKTEKQTWIEKELIGASYALFVNSVAYVQGGENSFLNQSAARRKELLLEIIKAEEIDDVKKRSTTLLSDLNKELRTLEDEHMVLSGLIQSWETGISGEEALKLEEVTIEEQKEKLLARKKEYSKRLDSFIKKKEDAKSLGSLLQEMESHWKVLEENVDELTRKKRMKDQWEEMASKLPELHTQKNGLIREREEIKSQLEDLTKRERESPTYPTAEFRELEFLDQHIQHYASTKVCPSGKDCPYYGNTLNRIEILKEDKQKKLLEIDEKIKKMQEWEIEVKDIKPQIDSLRKRLKEVENGLIETKATISTYDRVDSDLMKMAFLETDLLAAKKDFHELTDKIMRKREEKLELEDILKEENLDEITEEINALTLQEMKFRSRLSEISAELKQINKARDEIKKNEIKLEKVKEKEVELKKKREPLVLVETAFGAKGIKMVAIDYLLPRLEELVNNVLSKLSSLEVKVDTQRRSADGGSFVEGLFISVKNDEGQIIPIENLSGGEKTKVTVAFAEALASLQKCKFRIIDEAITALDAESLEHFLETLKMLQSTYPQIIVVSHIQEVKDMFEETINVVKHNGISRIKK